MKFRHRHRDEPEVNLIAFIDVLLVVLIFLMLSTSFSRYTALELTLPSAGSAPPKTQPLEIIVSVSADGRYAVNGNALGPVEVPVLAAALREAAQQRTDAQIVVAADALAPHQRVLNVLDAARSVGLARIAYAAQHTPTP
ncbi:MAG: biopolymer transporter ExbD [Inhella sp.]|jgi:biopolymer transport protein ExbD|uniref:ExbD/TolR family protein n=1 Tax=Inhella sp. TaxID=1921806 RepID=UPI0022C286CE|nr:biopolymer transporter ExbD [Inhella sp.]MCZ8236511.1 biopolymer transporter ExbD [Inhella sp.]